MKKDLAGTFISGLIVLSLLSCNNTAPEQKVAPAMENQPAGSAGIKIDAALLATTSDLVCGMSVAEEIADTTSYNGKLYGFCSSSCKEDFLKEPAKYVK